MLTHLFISVLNMSLIASYVIIVVGSIRLLLKKAPKIFSYVLWGVVLIRLLCPFSFESIIGVLPNNTKPISEDIIYQQVPQVHTGINGLDSAINTVLPPAINPAESINPLQLWILIGSYIWLMGIIVMLLFSIIQLIRLKRELIGVTPLRDNIYLADHMPSPFVIGLIKPKIYLPSDLSQSEQVFIIKHEQCHIKRFDPIIRIISYVALCIHWFNPLVWGAFILSGKDMEMSCDEAVMRSMDTDIRIAYASTLLKFATGKKRIGATSLAFGEGETKSRIKNVVKYKKPIIGVSIILLTIISIIAIGLMSSSPKEKKSAHSAYQVEDLYKSPTSYVANSSTDTLEMAINKAILEWEDASRYDYMCESHTLLKVQEGSSMKESQVTKQVKAYLLVLVLGFNIEGRTFTEEGGSYIPMAITFDVSADGEYTVKDYWIPRDGAYYAKDIKEKFPGDVYQLVLSDQDFINAHMQKCYEQVIVYGNIDTERMISDLIDEIYNMEDDPSNWRRQAKERDLTYFGDYLLAYARKRALEGNQMSEKEKILEKACSVLLK